MIEGAFLLIVCVCMCVPSAVQCFILCCLMQQSFKLSGTFIVFTGILDFGFRISIVTSNRRNTILKLLVIVKRIMNIFDLYFYEALKY